MRAEELRRSLGRLHRLHFLPEIDGPVGIVSRHRHENEPEAIGLQFMEPAVGKQNTHFRRHPVDLHEKVLGLLRLFLQRHGEGLSAEFGEQSVRHALVAVFGDGMGDLMTHHNGKPRFVPRDRKDARVDGDLSSGHAPGVDRGILYQAELPLVSLERVRHPRVPEVLLNGLADLLSRTFHHLRVRCVLAELTLREEVAVVLKAHLSQHEGRDQGYSLPSGDRRGGTGADKDRCAAQAGGTHSDCSLHGIYSSKWVPVKATGFFHRSLPDLRELPMMCLRVSVRAQQCNQILETRMIPPIPAPPPDPGALAPSFSGWSPRIRR